MYMFDIWKAKRALCKAFDFYRKKKESYLKADINIYVQLEEIEYAIAYALCEYFDFECDNPFSDKWYITYDYIHYYDKCKEAYEKITKQNKTNHNTIWRIKDFKSNSNYSKGDITMINRRLYYYDGKYFINMC